MATSFVGTHATSSQPACPHARAARFCAGSGDHRESTSTPLRPRLRRSSSYELLGLNASAPFRLPAASSQTQRGRARFIPKFRGAAYLYHPESAVEGLKRFTAKDFSGLPDGVYLFSLDVGNLQVQHVDMQSGPAMRICARFDVTSRKFRIDRNGV
eukprot:6182784-Pleurochrysis_carterae.AAC.1